jgi:UTP--glucose-1-phosphate uridylyltransferase
MLPIVDKPLIQYAAEEAIAAGATELIFITGRNKRSIEDHFDNAAELEASLEASGKTQMLEALKGILPSHVSCIFIRQPKALGLGHAVLCAKPVVGDAPFSVILADDLIDADVAVSKQMAEVYAKQLKSIVEKPKPADAPSTLAVVGRYILTPRIFECLEHVKPGKGGEIQLTDGISDLLTKENVYAYRFTGKRYDCGSKLGFMKANVELAMKHPEIAQEFAQYLKTL